MTSVLQSPFYLLFLIACAPSDYLKLVPLLAIYFLTDERHPGEFLALAAGDFFLTLVTSFDNYIVLNIGISAFLVFVWSRLFIEAATFSPKRKWPILLFFILAVLLIIFHPIEEFLLGYYVFSLSFLLGIRFCQDDKLNLTLGYSLYVISDCLLLVSLSHRFWCDWIIVRLLYWSGLTLIYV